jgi:hypothetical protein
VQISIVKTKFWAREVSLMNMHHTAYREGRVRVVIGRLSMIKLRVDPNIKLPVFYATALAQLPPADISYFDESAILSELQALCAEVRQLDISSLLAQIH